VGRRIEDYRPGLPVHRFWSVFVPASGPASARFVGQVEQMHESRCFRASKGELGCISCHDPHRLPAPETRVAYYRQRCLECHADRGCSLPADVRLARSPVDDCIGCHMPRSKSNDIPHVATTDHRIPRQEARKDSLPSWGMAQRSRGPSLVNFHRGLMDADELHDVNRDLGIALSRGGPDSAAAALPWLDEAVAARPDDMAARQARGVALRWLGRAQEALAVFQATLEHDPDRELLLKDAAHGAILAGKTELAIGYMRHAISINPWRSDYRASLAFLLFQAGDWQSATEACRETLRLNIANLDVRKLLVQCHLRLGDSAAARAEFERLLGFDPPDRDELPKWFASESRLR
jgi:predicted CXXCH cytochrome family protein